MHPSRMKFFLAVYVHPLATEIASEELSTKCWIQYKIENVSPFSKQIVIVLLRGE
jgi:hypothetical protein